MSRYLGIKPQPLLNSNTTPASNTYGIIADKYTNSSHNNSNSNSSNHNKLSFMMNNEQLLQHRLSSMDAAAVSGVAPSNFIGLGGAMKARNFSNTTADFDEDSDAPTPPKLRISNSLTDSMPTASGTNLNNNDNDDENIENNTNKNNNRTPTPLTNDKTYEHNVPQPPPAPLPSSSLPLPMPLPLPLTNNDPDDDDEDSRLSAKSALKAAFVVQQKEFLIQQQLQQQQQHQQQHQHQHAHAPHTNHHQHLHQHLYDDEHSFDQQYQRSLQQQYSDVGYLHEAENSGSRQRKERMSKRQKELYVEFLEQNPIVNSHRRNDPVLDGFWLRLANILNDCPNGAAKSVAEWKQAFDNWRYRVFLYARHNSQLNIEDVELNSKAFKPLTLSDKRAYNLWIRNPDTAPANIEKLPTDFNCSED